MTQARGFGLIGQHKSFKYRGGGGSGTVTGVVKAGASKASTVFSVEPNAASRHPGEPARIHRRGDKLYADGGPVQRARGFMSRRHQQIEDAIREADAKAQPPQPREPAPWERNPDKFDKRRVTKDNPAGIRFADGGPVSDDEHRRRGGNLGKDAVMRAIQQQQPKGTAESRGFQPKKVLQQAFSGTRFDNRGRLSRQMRAAGLEDEQRFEDGGRVRPKGFVRGPGTPTSDSIPAKLPVGGYILPADTTRQVGVDKLNAVLDATHDPGKAAAPHVDARVSDEEFALPPDTVDAVGIENLDALRAATHSPTQGVPRRNEKDGIFLADGGTTDEDERRRRMMSELDRVNQVSPAQRQQLDQQAVTARMNETALGRLADSNFADQAINTAMALPGVGGVLRGSALAARGLQASGGALGLGARAVAPIARRVGPYIPAGGMYAAAMRNDGKTEARSVVPAAQAATQPESNPPSVVPTTTPLPGVEEAPGRQGQANSTDGQIAFDPATNTYSGSNIAYNPNQQIVGGRGGGGFMGSGSPSPSSDRVAYYNNLADQYRAMRQVDAPQQATGFNIETPRPPSELELRNARITAEMRADDQRRNIRNMGGRGRNVQQRETPAEQQYRALLERDAQARGFQSEAQREAMRQAGADLRDQRADARMGERNALEALRVADESQASAFTNREAQRRESILAQYDAATPDGKARLREQYPDVFGQPDRERASDRYVVFNRGFNDMGQNMGQGVFDAQTGQEVGGQQEPAPQLPQSRAQWAPGAIYTAPNGQRVRWDGKGFIAAG